MHCCFGRAPLEEKRASLVLAADNTYIAAVVEYSPAAFSFPQNITKEEAEGYMFLNIKQYGIFADHAHGQGAEIIVFPEYGITGNTFESRDGALPFLEQIPDPTSSSEPVGIAYIPSQLTCMASQFDILIVVNMADIVPCNSTDPNCPADGRYQYNTQVAFGNTGAVLAKYHKSHLYSGEALVFNQPPVPLPVTFQSQFNVTFGMMICFDICFEEPQKSLVDSGVRNFVYSTEWVNANYAYARQMQQALSQYGQANVLASNIGTMYPISGSGIYSAGQPLLTQFNPTFTPDSEMLIATLPKIPIVYSSSSSTPKSSPLSVSLSNNEVDLQMPTTERIQRLRGVQPNTFNSTFTIFKPLSNQQSITQTSVNNGFTCTFTYTTHTIPETDAFALISFNGNLNNNYNSQICTLAICSETDISPEGCSELYASSNTAFHDFYFSGDFSADYHVNAMIYSNNPLSNFYEDYNAVTSTFDISKMNDPIISASMFAIQWS
eukprot:gene1428-1657_t